MILVTSKECSHNMTKWVAHIYRTRTSDTKPIHSFAKLPRCAMSSNTYGNDASFPPSLIFSPGRVFSSNIQPSQLFMNISCSRANGLLLRTPFDKHPLPDSLMPIDSLVNPKPTGHNSTAQMLTEMFPGEGAGMQCVWTDRMD